MFNVYDKDGGGTIDPQEMRGIVSGLFTMVGIQGIEEDMVEENSLEMLKIIDSDGDGEITKDEFLQNAMTCDFIRDMFQIGALDDLDNEENPIQIEDKAQESQNLDSFKEDLRKSMDFSVLERKLCLIEDEIEDEYNDFMAVYTFGEMTRREFVHYCNRADGLTEDEAESLFNVFDADGSGSMDFMEFMMAKNATDLRWLYILSLTPHFYISNILHITHKMYIFKARKPTQTFEIQKAFFVPYLRETSLKKPLSF